MGTSNMNRHLLPDDDAIEHEESMNCICGPTVVDVSEEPIRVFIKHHRLVGDDDDPGSD